MTTPDATNSPDPQAVSAFCQQCGQPLTVQTRRDVGGAIFCEPCLEARLAGAPGPGASAAGGPPYTAHPYSTPPLRSAPPNPRLAALLGFIPGVGAMYNEQYAKGIAHLAIFALLVVLSDANAIFGLFIAGWEFYMVMEAYHTAVARRDGMPLPNPFGFNDLGDRLGFARGWTHPGRPVPGAAGQTGPGPSPAGSEPAATPSSAWESAGSYQAAAWGGPTAGSHQPFAAAPPFQPVEPVLPVQPIASASPLGRVPLGALWLILLGLVFLLSTTGHFHEFSPESLVGWGLMGLAGWIFLVRLRETAPAASAAGRLHHALQPSAWVLTSGLLAVLDGSGVLSWGRSWPVFLITAGLLAMLARVSPAGSTMPQSPPVPPSRPL